ncbi:MAG TPA: precorrin-6y C5,15-methyltransferase (decarboxylating) subunit CbiE, partial [Streptosporangiaceae bacterium]|nr:precorrin-6y C5,15-methyltransferase (decarboxylating) subunit CbiE [Streptosporangiaceae bacterium]
MNSPASTSDPPVQITVVGIGAEGWRSLTEDARDALTEATAIAGSARQLGLLPDLAARQVRLPSPLLEHLDELVREIPGLCVLASGDPTLHGIGATLARRLGAAAVRIVPGVSSVALACARLGWPQHEITVVSLVSQRPEATLAALQPGGRLIVLCRDRHTPPAVARVLTDRGWGASELIVLEQLSGPAERIGRPRQATELTAAAEQDLCLLAITARQGRGAVAGRTAGLPDSAYETDGQVTRRELRALALAVLRPGPGQVLWDIGAGSGSIGIEWMRVHPASRAIAVEPREDRRSRIARNAAALGVPGLRVVAGAAPLPRTPGLPDDAFEHDGQLTKRELRALALAALAPVPGQLLWDVGAGSGSIGIEWMRVHAASRAIAIEPRADRRERI